MNNVMPEEELKTVLDRITREVTEETTGIRLIQGGDAPEEGLHTVHIEFCQGFHSSLSLRVDAGMLTRLTQSILNEENVTPQDTEDVAKEYFNVLCGQIAAALFEATRIASRFSVPSFYRGIYSPEGRREQFALSYFSGRRESVRLVHHVPVLLNGAQMEHA